MATLKELRDKQLKLVADARVKLDEISAEGVAEARAKELETEYDAVMAEHDKIEADCVRQEEQDAKKAKLEARQEELKAKEAALNTPDPRRPTGEDRAAPGAGEDEKPLDDEEYRKAFNSYLRNGREGMTPELRTALRKGSELRVQQSTTNTEGGYTVPQGFMAELIKSLAAWGPMMDGTLTRVLNTSTGNSIPWPSMDDTSNSGSLLTEGTQVSTSAVTFGTKNLDAYKYTSGVVLISSELLQDSALNIEEIIRAAMAERIGRKGNTDLTTADGSAKPHGIVPAAGAGYTAASATAIAWDDIIELFHSVDPAYREDPSCRFMFKDSTLKALRKLKNGEGQYIWQPADVKNAQPATILDKPYAINSAMAAIGTGNKSVTFGAMNRYVVRRVNEFQIKRLVERYADYDQTGFIGFTRFDGELLDAGAVRVLLHP